MKPARTSQIVAALMLLALSAAIAARGAAFAERARAQHACIAYAADQFRRGQDATAHRYIRGAERAYFTGRCGLHEAIEIALAGAG